MKGIGMKHFATLVAAVVVGAVLYALVAPTIDSAIAPAKSKDK